MRLHRPLYLLPLTVFVLFLTTLAHADFQDGLNAYERGDYETALKEDLGSLRDLTYMVLSGSNELGGPIGRYG